MGYRFRNMEIPQHMLEALLRYKERGIPPGDFLQAVLCNDLVEAVGRADDYNIEVIPAYADFLYNQLPRTAWGSEEAIDRYSKTQQLAYQQSLEETATNLQKDLETRAEAKRIEDIKLRHQLDREQIIRARALAGPPK